MSLSTLNMIYKVANDDSPLWYLQTCVIEKNKSYPSCNSKFDIALKRVWRYQRADNTMGRGNRTNNDLQNIHIKVKIG